VTVQEQPGNLALLSWYFWGDRTGDLQADSLQAGRGVSIGFAVSARASSDGTVPRDAPPK
jgi:hypothetical protein